MMETTSLIISSVTCVALVLTLIFVVKYTIQTKKIADVSIMEFDRRTEPVITPSLSIQPASISIEQPMAFDAMKETGLQLTLTNHAYSHALVRIRLDFKLAGKPLPPLPLTEGDKSILVLAKDTATLNFSFEDIINKTSESGSLRGFLVEQGVDKDSDFLLDQGIISAAHALNHNLGAEEEKDIDNFLLLTKYLTCQLIIECCDLKSKKPISASTLPVLEYRVYRQEPANGTFKLQCNNVV